MYVFSLFVLDPLLHAREPLIYFSNLSRFVVRLVHI